jgi:hypothetical protein
VAIGALATVVALAIGAGYLSRGEQEAAVPPFPQQEEVGDQLLQVEDPRAEPAFDGAHRLVCSETILGLDSMYAAAAAGTPDLTPTIDAQYQALTQRITSVYDRADLWSATDPLVLEYAEAIADDLASILDGTDEGFGYLDGDVALFRSLCDDWFAPR